MNIFNKLVLLLIICFKFTYANKKIVCYVGTWSVYRHGHGKFEVNDVDPFLCTHLMYGFFGINVDGSIRVIDAYLDLEENWGRGNIKKFNGLKKVNPNLKTMAAVGGWNEGSHKFSVVAADRNLRKKFTKSAVVFCLKHGFDGLDLDWEYPAQRDGNKEVDKENYIYLLKDLRKSFNQNNLLLSAAVASAKFSASVSYNISKVSKYLDFINVMAYDFHGSWDSYVGINAPLYRGPADKSSLQKQLNVNSSIHYWLKHGAPREKLILGMPLYGRTFALSNVQNSEVGASSSGPGEGGQYSNEAGMIGYNELCEKMMSEKWQQNWSKEQQVPFAIKGNQWVGYENTESIRLKSQYLMNMELGGAMVWSLETDDFRGICGSGKYPLMKTINTVLNGGRFPSLPQTNIILPSTTSSTTVTATHPTFNQRRSAECTKSGIFASLESCNKYIMCQDSQKYEFNCPEGLLFDKVKMVCNWPGKVRCK